MLTTKRTGTSKRPLATCLMCTSLENNCILKADILSETRTVCNFAREGCVRYHGVGETGDNLRLLIRQKLLTGKLISVKQISEELNINSEDFSAHIKQIRRKGMKVESIRKSRQAYYQLNTK